MEGTRYMSFHRLSDRLRQFEREGVVVPVLHPQLYKNAPTFVEMRGNVEIYSLDGTEVKIGPSEVIDTFGNIVDLERLHREAHLAAVRKLMVDMDLREY